MVIKKPERTLSYILTFRLGVVGGQHSIPPDWFKTWHVVGLGLSEVVVNIPSISLSSSKVFTLLDGDRSQAVPALTGEFLLYEWIKSHSHSYWISLHSVTRLMTDFMGCCVHVRRNNPAERHLNKTSHRSAPHCTHYILCPVQIKDIATRLLLSSHYITILIIVCSCRVLAQQKKQSDDILETSFCLFILFYFKFSNISLCELFISPWWK